MSKIQDFVDSYALKIQESVNTQIDKQNLYKTTRVQAITITEPNISGWPNTSITTIGQLIAYIFPSVDGGVRILPEAIIGGTSPNPDYFNTIAILNGKDSSTSTKELYTILSKNYTAKNSIDTLNRAKSFGGQKWFDTFMGSALGHMKTSSHVISDYKTSSIFDGEYNNFVKNFRKNFGYSITEHYYTSTQTLYDAFIEAGDNYNLPATQSGATQSGATQSNIKSGDYKITVKDPKSDNDKRIEGFISFVELGPRVSADSVLNNLPNPFTDTRTNLPVENNTGSITYKSLHLSKSDYPDTYEKVLADESIKNLQVIIADRYGVDFLLTYEPVNLEPQSGASQSGTTQSSIPLTTTQSGATQSNFDATGIKVTLIKKSGPGEIIGITDKIVNNGYINFDGIQFDEAGDYVITVMPDSNLIEPTDVNITVISSDDIVPQEQTRGEEKPISGTRPIIAQIDKPTIKLKPIEFDGTNDKNDKEVGAALGFVPFFWYNGYQVSPRDIKSLKVYYDGLVPKAMINFADSVGFMKKEGFPLDDTKFEVFLNSGSKNLKSIHMKFKLINFQENKGKSYTITGSIDLSDFYKINFKSYRGTSFEVLRNVSNELQLGYNSNITNTIDNMNWVNNGKIFKDFLSGIIGHSYISDTSYVLGYIDYYYCFNYVDIEKEWIRDISNDVGLASSGINHLNEDSQKDKIERMLLTNDQSAQASPFHFSKYKVNNNSTQISTTKGYFTTSKSYDSLTKQFLVFDVDSQNADESKNVTLKGAPGDGKSMDENYRTKYSGKMDTENVYKNYYYSEIQNKVNLDNMVRISVDLELPNANFNLYKFMKIELAFINQKNTPTNTDVSQERLSGEWMIIDIAYIWVGGKLTQNVKCVRKELSKTKDEIKEDKNNPTTKPEVNTENNENPGPSASTPTKVNLPPNSVYKVGEIYNVESKDGKKYTLEITSISTNGNEVNAIIKNSN